MTIYSTYVTKGKVEFPAFSHVRVMMMPVVLGDEKSIPEIINPYRALLIKLFELQTYFGQVGYITIDEKMVASGRTHRRPGLHVDGVHKTQAGGWGGGGTWGGNAWQGKGTGFLTVSSHAMCKVWDQEFEGLPDADGACEHLADQCREECAALLKESIVYWLDPLCVHTSIPAERPVQRQFLRLSLPSNGPWFEGYTKNPLGVLPTGEILPRRPQMDYA